MIEELYKQHFNNIYRFAYFRTGSKAEAEDIASYAFMKLMEQTDLAKITAVKTWLITVARNHMINKYREQKNSSSFSLDETNGLGQVDDQEQIEQSAVREEFVQILQDQIKNLSIEEKEIISLHVWENYKFKEIAEVLNENENTVKAVYYRALSKLKKNIESKHRFNYAISFPLFFAGFAALGSAPEYQISATQIINILNKLSMQAPNNIAPTLPVGEAVVSTASKGVLSIFGFSAVAIMGVAVLAGVVIINNRNDNTTPTPTVSQTIVPSVQPSGAIEPTIQSTLVPSVAPTSTGQTPNFSFELHNLYGGETHTVSGVMPQDAQLVKIDDSMYEIRGNDYTLGIAEVGEGEITSYEEVVDIGATPLGRMYRVRFAFGGGEPIHYNYLLADDIQSTTTACPYLGENYPAPCGASTIGMGWGSLPIGCSTISDVAICDNIMKTLTIR